MIIAGTIYSKIYYNEKISLFTEAIIHDCIIVVILTGLL